MKATKLLIAAATLAMVSSCADHDVIGGGDGSVVLNARIDQGLQVVSRATLDEEYGDALKLWISNDKGLIRQYQGLDNIPTEALPLLSGTYVAEAWAGDSVSASWDKKWFKAYVPFTVAKDQTSQVDVTLKIANVVVSVEYSDDVADVLGEDIKLHVGHSRGQLDFEGYDIADKMAYFMMPKADKDLTWTLVGTKKADGVTMFTRAGTIANVQPAHHYIFKVSCEPNDTGELGGGYGLTIEVDDTEIYVEDNVTIPTPPIIKGGTFDIDKTIICQPDEKANYSVYVFGSSALTSVIVEGDRLAEVLGIAGADDFDVMAMSDAFRAQLEAAGITTAYTYDDGDGTSRLRMVFTDVFTARLDEGAYAFAITATDSDGYTTTKTLAFEVTTNPISAFDTVDASAVTLTNQTVTVGGTINKAGEVSDVAIEYRPVQAISRADAEWLRVPAVISGDTFSAVISDLWLGYKYEWRAVAGDFATASQTFETPGLPNAGFEDWQTASAPYLIYPSGGSMFWDSGNHGSSTMRKNVTTPDATVKHSGQYSVKLASQFVGIGSLGKFAAGNIFIGEYLATVGTNGVIGFGRPFTSKPKGIRGWVKYTTAPIDNVASDAPAEYVKGQNDKGIIYMALLDDTRAEYNGNTDYPVVVRTDTKQLFDKTASNVIAYGEIIWSESTDGDGMVEFYIPFEYYRDEVPSFLMLTASASKGGDYFTGGAGATMWLDDIQLVYE